MYYLNITNQGDQPTKFVKVAGAFYNDQNQLVAVRSSYTDPSDSSARATASFEILITTPNVDQIMSARLNAQSEDYSTILTTTTGSTETSSVPAEE
jgi:hypothetical protein